MSDTKISIVCPTLNEERFVANLIQVFLSNCPQPSELFFADAGSSDQTVEVIQKWSAVHPNVKLVLNERKYVSQAFNICFPMSSGKYIALLGAHTTYPSDFFKVAYTILEQNECDAVGGPLHQVANSTIGKAIAYCMSNRMGVGGTEFRVSKERMFVDSVAFAFYKREIFETIGLFDEKLIRNQDDEMHYRMNAAGYKILMVPEMQCTYYVRESLSTLFNQYFQYGLYKPMVLKRVMSGIRIRHLIPVFFILYILSLPLSFLLVGIFAFFPLLLYVALLLYVSFSSNLSIRTKVLALLVFPTLHISYGSGFLLGLRKIF